jgi:hypothetical protein
MTFEIPGPQPPPSDERLAMIEQRLARLNEALLALMAAAAPKLLEDVADEPGAGQEIQAVLGAISDIQARVSAANGREALGPASSQPEAVAIAESPAPPAPAAPAGSWRDAVPPELFERVRARSNGSGREALPAGDRGRVLPG